jgi:hypothetical protein
MATPPRLPVSSFTAPTTGTLEQRLRIIAEAINRKADQTQEPVYSAVLLLAPGGATWRVSVNDAGVLSAVVVQRS